MNVMNVPELLIETLKKTGYPVIRQGAMAADEKYPETFLTFWNAETESTEYYDNREHCIIWDYQVNVYSEDPEKVYSVMGEITGLLKLRGFAVSGRGHDVASDEPTHTGRGTKVLYFEK